MTVRAGLIAGAAAGLVAALAFATAHALIITPVWSRMMGGLVFGVIAGAAAGWAYAELRRPGEKPSVVSGFRYGVLLWLAVVPVTLTNAGLRANGFAAAHEMTTDTIAVALALAGGATLGWLRRGHWRAVISCAVATVAVTMAMGGPVPVGRGVRAVEILFAVLAACVIGGVVVGIIAPRIEGRGVSSGASATP